MTLLKALKTDSDNAVGFVGVQYFSKHQKALSKTELKKFLPLTTSFIITISLFYIRMGFT